MKHCCINLKYYLDKGVELEYESQFRAYYLKLQQDEDNCTAQEIWYCPWCGTKLPKDLDGIWFKVLKEEYGITDPIVKDKDRIPPEFKTDEWWKKRGL
jgi:hypothetical protein